VCAGWLRWRALVSHLSLTWPSAQGLFRSLDIDGSGTVDRNELGQ
jgi:hypothetical protein